MKEDYDCGCCNGSGYIQITAECPDCNYYHPEPLVPTADEFLECAMKEEMTTEKLLNEARMMRHASWGGQPEEMRLLIHQLVFRLESAREAMSQAVEMLIETKSRLEARDVLRRELER